MKTANVWRCADCHKVGFYYDKTDEEFIAEHRESCDGNVSITETEYFNLSDKNISKARIN